MKQQKNSTGCPPSRTFISSETTSERSIADILRTLLRKNISDSQGFEELASVLQQIPESEQIKIKHLCDIGVSEKHLLTILRNRQQSIKNKLNPKLLAAVVEEVAVSTDNQPLVEENTLNPPLLSKRQKKFVTILRSVYIHNPTPAYQTHEWLNQTPPLIQRLVWSALRRLPPGFWDHLHALHKIRGMQIKVRVHRIQAIQAIMPCLFATMNVSSLRCLACVKSIAKQCGLTISRVSRALKDLADCGLLTKQLLRNPAGTYQPLVISLSQKLLALLGVSSLALGREQKKHKKLSKPSSQITSLTSKKSCPVAQSLAKFTGALKNAGKSLLSANQATTIVAHKVSELLKSCGLGRDCNTTLG